MTAAAAYSAASFVMVGTAFALIFALTGRMDLAITWMALMTVLVVALLTFGTTQWLRHRIEALRNSKTEGPS